VCIEMANTYIEAILGKFVHVHQSEIRPLLHAFSAFFFVSTSLHIFILSSLEAFNVVLFMTLDWEETSTKCLF
jgi:hypothetical protein